MTIKAIIFDRDGVLIDSEAIHVESVKLAFADVGLTFDDKYQNQVVARHPNEYLREFQKIYTFDFEEVDKIQSQHYYKLFETVPTIPQVIELIEQNDTTKTKLALATSSDQYTTQKLLKRLDLEKAFEVITTSNECPNRKPLPDPYLLTAEKLNLKPEECLVIEDSGVGVQSAKAAGMTCLAIPSKYTKNNDFSKADYICTNLMNFQEKVHTIIQNSKMG